MPCTNVGVEMRSADGGWSDELEEALQEWREKKTVCEFMEWHTDQLFVPVVPTLTAIYCKTAGGASTAIASGVNGLRTLPPELRERIAAFFLTEGPDGPSSLLLENLGVDPDLPLSTEPQEVADDLRLAVIRPADPPWAISAWGSSWGDPRLGALPGQAPPGDPPGMSPAWDSSLGILPG